MHAALLELISNSLNSDSSSIPLPLLLFVDTVTPESRDEYAFRTCHQMEIQVTTDWWKEGYKFSLQLRPAGLAVAAVYALTYLIARSLSVDQFFLPAGVRICALLLAPRAFWPYLILGECSAFAWLRLPMVAEYGWTWAVAGSVLLMPCAMLIMHLHRRLMEAKTDIWLISVAASTTVAITALNVGISFLLWPMHPGDGFGTDITRFVVGDFIGIITLAPLALLWLRRRVQQPILDTAIAPTVFFLSLMMLLAAAVLMLPVESPAAKTNVLLLMALPAVALTCLHGWRGAAVSVPLWSLVTRLTMPHSGIAESFDPAAFSVHQSIAIIGISLLALGSILSYYYQQFHLHTQEKQDHLSHARSSHIAGEMDLRARALDIRKLGDNLDTSLCELAEWLRQKGHDDLSASLLKVTTVHSQRFREQVTMVYPTSLEHVGLYLALQISGINEQWQKTHRLALHRLAGDPCQLSIGLQLATYRTLTEAVALLMEQESGQIQVRARCGMFAGYRGILVSVALLEGAQRLSTGTMALAVERLTGRTLAYNGTVQCRRNRIRLLLVETVDEAVPA